MKNPIFSDDEQLQLIFLVGIFIRVIVFIFQSPFNNDYHFEIVEYIFNTHAIPISSQFGQAYHPPLYYLIASLFLFLGGAKTVQIFSLLSSIGTLVVFYWLIKNVKFIQTIKIKKCCLLLACLLPQLVMFGNYISNDSLSFFVGSLVFLQIFRYIKDPTMFKQNILAVLLGLGLLTKGTFLSFVPVLLTLVILMNHKNKTGAKNIFLSVFIFLLVSLSIGSYKFLENTINFGTPFFSNMDIYQWVESQRPTYIGLTSIFDINILKLAEHPTLSEDTRYSYPLLLYGTFWYQYIPESNFKGNLSDFRYLGGLIYILALVPTLIFAVGFFRIAGSVKNAFFCPGRKSLKKTEFDKITYESTSLFLLMANVLLVLYSGIKYDVWSAFQSRLLFANFFAIIILFNSGLECLPKRSRIVEGVAYCLLTVLFLLFVAYFGIEIWLIIH